MRAQVPSLFLIALLACSAPGGSEPNAPQGPPAQPEPDATIQIQATSLAAGVGYSWGKGTLEYQGKTYPVTMQGMMVVAVGIDSIDARGSVYRLKSLDDFDGNYTAKRGASTIGEGGAGVVMSNQNGVEVRMVARNRGVTLSLGASGVNLTLER